MAFRLARDARMPPTESPPLRFEQALGELEAILRELEDGTTSLEDALTRYERGVGLLRQCYAQLRDAEQKVKLLAGLTETGSADLKPFDTRPRSRRRKSVGSGKRESRVNRIEWEQSVAGDLWHELKTRQERIEAALEAALHRITANGPARRRRRDGAIVCWPPASGFDRCWSCWPARRPRIAEEPCRPRARWR